ncbi:DUF4214 domain-containing protein [Cellulomonas sp. Marseille-Q8402]
MLRTLLALSIALGAGVAPTALAPEGVTPAPASVASGEATAASVPADAAVDVTVEQTPLVVVAAEEATPGEPGEPGEPAGTDAAASSSAQPETSAAPTPTPTPAPERSVDPADGTVVADVLTTAGRVVTPAVETGAAQTVGVTWPEGADAGDLAPEVRSLSDGEWSDWIPLGLSDSEPDAGTADAERAARGGTDSYWVGESEAVQLSFAATADGGPADLSLALVASEEPAGIVEGASATGDAVVRTAAYTTPAAASVVPAAAGQPAVVLRGQWGARNQACAPDVAGRLEGAVVHHTAGSNSYTTQAQAMQQIRNDQAYHIDARGWCDIGYNFVVDKFGTIYEGRANSLTQAVIGVHASGANTGTVGVSMLGNYDTVPTTPQMIDAVGRIIGWRLAAYGVDPRGSGTYPSGLYLPRVIGHRDVAQTACPGRYGYAQLGTIRAIAAVSGPAMPLADAQALVRQLYQDVLGRGADAGGLSTWSQVLVAGTSPAQLATTLVRSTEYAQATVTRDYQAVLGRAPDPYGMRDWTAAITSGSVRSEDLRLWLYSSVEFYQRNGNTDATYVAALYQSVLGRPAGQAEINQWAPVAGRYGSASVLGGVWGSMESANVRVEAFYQRYLKRSVDPAGRASWAPVLLSYGEDRLRDQIVGSLEYYQMAQRTYA